MLTFAVLMSASVGAAPRQWFSLGEVDLPVGEGARHPSFDLAKAGVTSARYVKIMDLGDGVLIDAIIATSHAGSDANADDLLDFHLGEKGDLGTVGSILGEPEYPGAGTAYARLGRGGWIMLDMGAREEIIDGPGDDFRILSMGGGKIRVYVSSGDGGVEMRRIEVERTQFGSISIESSPGTIVHLDGKEIGEAPRWIDNVSLGMHDIELKNRYDTHLERVSVEPGKIVKLKHSFLIEVPKLIGLNERTAKEKLTVLGFVPKVNYTTDIEQLFGRVLNQSPKPDQKLEIGSTVEITINKEARY